MEINIESISRVLDALGKQHSFASAVWGSLQRGETTTLSDVDIIVYAPNRTSDIVEIIINHLSCAYHERDIYWDIALIEDDIDDYLRQNGTNFHSIYFAGKPVGNKECVNILNKRINSIISDKESILREFFNVFTSFWGLAHVISVKDDRYGKFSLNGTNKWVRLFQAAQLRWPRLRLEKSISVLSFLCHRYNLNKDEYIEAYMSDFKIRELLECGEIAPTNLGISEIWLTLFNQFIKDNINWIQHNGIDKELLTQFVKTISPNSNIYIPAPIHINKAASKILSAFTVKSEFEINMLLEENKSDWWTLTNLCLNPHTSASTLQRIVFPDFEVNPILWKSIRLYVAKNVNTSTETLKQILLTDGLREQDYKAAQTNLKNRGIIVPRP